MSRREEIVLAEAKLVAEYIKYLERQKEIEKRGNLVIGVDSAYKSALRKLEKLIAE